MTVTVKRYVSLKIYRSQLDSMRADVHMQGECVQGLRAHFYTVKVDSNLLGMLTAKFYNYVAT